MAQTVVTGGNIPLHRLPVGKMARVTSLLNDGKARRRLLDLGLTPNALIASERKSPPGNPIAYNIRGSVIALRNEEAQYVSVTPI